MSQISGPGIGGSPIGVARIDIIGDFGKLQQDFQQAKAVAAQGAAEVQQAASQAATQTAQATTETAAATQRYASTAPQALRQVQEAWQQTTDRVQQQQSAILELKKGLAGVAAIVGIVTAATTKAVTVFRDWLVSLRETQAALQDVGTQAGKAIVEASTGVQRSTRAYDDYNKKIQEINKTEEELIQNAIKDERLSKEASDAAIRDIQIQSEAARALAKQLRDDRLASEERQRINSANIRREAEQQRQAREANLPNSAAVRARREQEAAEQDKIDEAMMERRRKRREKLIADELKMEERKRDAIERMERDLQNTLTTIRNSASGSVQNETFYQLDAIRQAVEVIRQQNPGSLVG